MSRKILIEPNKITTWYTENPTIKDVFSTADGMNVEYDSRNSVIRLIPNPGTHKPTLHISVFSELDNVYGTTTLEEFTNYIIDNNFFNSASGGSGAQSMLIHTPRLNGVLTDDDFRSLNTVSGYGSDSLTNYSLNTVLTSSILPIAGIIRENDLKLKSLKITNSLTLNLDLYFITIYAKELNTDSTGISNPIPVSVQEIAKISLSNLGNRGYLKEFIINSNILLKKDMTIEIYLTGTAGNVLTSDLRSPMFNLIFEK